jgi:hypothetical protein
MAECLERKWLLLIDSELYPVELLLQLLFDVYEYEHVRLSKHHNNINIARLL